MLRKVASKVAWVGRTAFMVFGLALVLSLIFGVATMALGANGKPFILGQKNVATAVSTLVKKGAGPALSLKVGSGAPLAVNSSEKVTNLNADQIDGMDSAQFVQGSAKIHRYGPVIVSANAPIQDLIVVGPFLIRGECDDAPTRTDTITQLVVDETARPYSAAFLTSTGFHSSPNSTDDRVDLMRDLQGSMMNTTVGSVVSLEGEDRQITFNLYQHRSTDPASGAVSCTFGGYVQE